MKPNRLTFGAVTIIGPLLVATALSCSDDGGDSATDPDSKALAKAEKEREAAEAELEDAQQQLDAARNDLEEALAALEDASEGEGDSETAAALTDAQEALAEAEGALADAEARLVEAEQEATNEAPLYAVAATQFSPDSSTTLLRLIENPQEAVTLWQADGIELPGTAALYGMNRAGRVIVGSSDGPTLVEYTLEGDELQEGRSMSLLNTGVESAFLRPGLVPFVSEEKAYWLSDTLLEAIIWNPSEMTIEGSFSLAAAEDDGLFFELGEAAVERDGLLFVGANQRNDIDGEAGKAMVLVIDSNTDELVTIAEDTRCGNTLHVVNHEGTLYVASGTIAAIVELQGHQPGYPEPCMLRILPDELSFDPDFYVTMSTVLDGHSGGRLVSTRGGKAFVTALYYEDLDASLVGPEADFWAPWSEPVWHWWEVELGSDEVGTPVLDAPPSSAGGRVMLVDGEQYIQHARSDEGRTTLYTTNQSGLMQQGITVVGTPYGLVRLR